METEQQPVTDDAGLEPGAGETDAQDTAEDTEPQGDQQAPAPGAAPADARPSRADRRRDFNEKLELRKTLDEIRKQNAELNRVNGELTRQMRDGMGRMTRAFEDAQPAREDPLVLAKKALDERWQKVVQRMDKDPSAADEFRELQLDYGKLGAAMERRQSAQSERRPSPLAQSLTLEFPFLDQETGDHEAQMMVNGEAARLARKEKRDMTNMQVRYTTLRQAAATVAKEMGYPVPASYNMPSSGPSGRERVAGTGGRGGTGAGGPDSFAGMEGDIEMAATMMYPNLEKPQAIAKWKREVGVKHLAKTR